MPAKKKVEGAEEKVVLPVKDDVIKPIEMDFGREDLNILRDKLNELIAIENER